jgi:hypothetical protein
MIYSQLRQEVRDLLVGRAGTERTTLEDGTELLGRVPHRGPEAWHHIIFRPLSAEEIRGLDAVVGRDLPTDLQAFYAAMNGLSIFSDSLSLFGLRANYDRRDRCERQPYDLTISNRFERLQGAPSSAVFFGAYGSDGSQLYVDSKSSSVHHCDRFSAEPLVSWPDLITMLRAEIERIAAYYSPDGLRRDGSSGSAPPPSAVV